MVVVAGAMQGEAKPVKGKKPVVRVAADGSGQFTTVQAAVDAAPEVGEVIEIAAGTYKEKLRIAGDGMELKGMGAGPEDTVLTYDDSAASAGGTGKSFSVSVTGDGFVAENLTIANDWEKTHGRMGEGSQAVALLITGDREVLDHVRLLGYQDTLYAASKTCHAQADMDAAQASGKVCQASRQLFENCYIEGHVDYIFGDAKAVFDHCELHGMAHSMVTITAQSKLYPLEDSGYLFLHCTITSDAGVGVLSFGRPWRAYARGWFVDTVVKGKELDPAGWMEWAGKLKTSDYAESGTRKANGEAVDVSGRLAPGRQLTAAEMKQATVKGWLEGWGWQR
jgi:pectinesterase